MLDRYTFWVVGKHGLGGIEDADDHVCNEFAAGIFGVREGWRARMKPAVDRYLPYRRSSATLSVLDQIYH